MASWHGMVMPMLYRWGVLLQDWCHYVLLLLLILILLFKRAMLLMVQLLLLLPVLRKLAASIKEHINRLPYRAVGQVASGRQGDGCTRHSVDQTDSPCGSTPR